MNARARARTVAPTVAWARAAFPRRALPLLFLIACLSANPGCGRRSSAPRPIEAAVPDRLSESEVEERLRQACSHCHAYAAPESTPRDQWRKELELAYSFIAESDLDPAVAPPIADAIAYFVSRAPERFPPAVIDDVPSPLKFRRRHLDTPVTYHGVASLASSSDQLCVADLRNGAVHRLDLGVSNAAPEPIRTGGFPCRVRVTDLDQDGWDDYLIADLGVMQASDAERGSVSWIRPDPKTGVVQRLDIVRGVGRVADAAAADVDQDGDLDVIVAEFGWRKTGSLFWLENPQSGRPISNVVERPPFLRHAIGGRIGAVQLAADDFDGDGTQDVLALFGQQHEQLILYRNVAAAAEPLIVFEAGDPGFGATGFDLADLDGDGDLDVALVNGDTLDFEFYRPSHGVRWLENQGWNQPFVVHDLTQLPGAMAVAVADMDQDGDQDIAACTLLPFGLTETSPGQDVTRLPSLIWLEQTEPRRFATHVLERGKHAHASILARDLDGDGDVDLATGYFTLEGVTSRAQFLTPFPGAATLWLNDQR